MNPVFAHPPSMSSRTTGQISRLAAVSHVLYDREVLELRGEIERQRDEIKRLRQQHQALMLNLFWKEHGVNALNDAARRVDHPNLARVHGIYRAWIEPILQACGLEVELVGGLMPYRGAQESDLDTHLVCSGLYVFVAYGAKLLKAKSVDDPEMRKLKALFDALNNFGDGPPTHATR